MFKFNSPEDRVILSADGLGLPGDSGDSRASKLVKLAETVGASTVTIGPDIATGSGWSWIHDLMENAGVDWMADTGISSDDPNVISRVVSTLVNFKYPPIAMHIGSGDAPMEAALRETEGSGTDILGIVDSGLLGEREHYNTTGYSPQDSLRNLAIRASKVGLSGIVGSPSDM